MIAPAKFSRDKNYGWYPEWNADNVVEIALHQRRAEREFFQPPVDPVRQLTEEEQWIEEIAKMHPSVPRLRQCDMKRRQVGGNNGGDQGHGADFEND